MAARAFAARPWIFSSPRTILSRGGRCAPFWNRKGIAARKRRTDARRWNCAAPVPAVRHPRFGDARARRVCGRAALRLDPRTRGMHIHCLTGRSDRSAVEEANKAGIEAYMTKPLDPIRLLEVVRQHFDGAEALQISHLSLTDARDQLDAWERTGFGGLEVAHQDETGFTVRCVRPPRCGNVG